MGGFVRATYAAALALLLDVPQVNLVLEEVDLEQVAPASVRVAALIRVGAGVEAMVALRTLVCANALACGAASSVLGMMVEAVEEPTFAPDGGIEVDGTVDGSDGALLC